MKKPFVSLAILLNFTVGSYAQAINCSAVINALRAPPGTFNPGKVAQLASIYNTFCLNHPSVPRPQAHFGPIGQAVEIGHPATIGTPTTIGRPVAIGTPAPIGRPAVIGTPATIGSSAPIGGPAAVGRPVAIGSPSNFNQPASVGQPATVAWPTQVATPTNSGTPVIVGRGVTAGQPTNVGTASQIGTVETIAVPTNIGRPASIGNPAQVGKVGNVGTGTNVGTTGANRPTGAPQVSSTVSSSRAVGATSAGHQSPSSTIAPTAVAAGLGLSLSRAEAGAVKWSSDNYSTGMSWEEYLATKLTSSTRLSPGYRTFDFFDQSSGKAISAKTLNTNADGYVQNPVNIYYRIRGWVNDAANFTKSRVGSSVMQDEDIAAKEIQLAIPADASPVQLEQIARGAAYAGEQDVNLVVTEVPVP
jgi:acyl-[acyl carrier protein]--UDP-N-acetylglucosamine O-acyltransferase